MYKSARRFSVLKRILDDGVLLSPKRVSSLETIRTYAGPLPALQRDYNTNSFGDILKFRRQQAKQTILVQLNNVKDCHELFDHLSEMGNINIMYHYSTNKAFQLALVEMEDEKDVWNVLNHCQNVESHIGAGYSNFLWFKPSKTNKRNNQKMVNNDKLHLNSHLYINKNFKKIDFLSDIRTIRTKMFENYENSKMNDLGYRLRFLTTNQVETSMKFMNPSLTVLPFGSSITGLGNREGDIDMVALVNRKSENESSDLAFLTKTFACERTMEQVHITLLYEIIKTTLPGCSDVIPIPHARVPIVKYRQNFTSLECDLSLYRVDSIIMSELLYFLSSLDFRVKFLVFLVRHWAAMEGLTNSAPGGWITNFSLTLLVLHFLQQSDYVNPPIIPKLMEIPLDRSTLLSNETYSELFNKFYANAESNSQTIEELLLGFFQFYSTFNYRNFGFSLISGEKITKSPSAYKALVIENPLSPDLNVSKNVTTKEVMRIKNCMNNQFVKLDSAMKSGKFDERNLNPMKSDLSDHKILNKNVLKTEQRARSNVLNLDFDDLMKS